MDSPLESLRKLHALEPESGTRGWLRFETVTPKFHFRSYVKPVNGGETLFQFTIRGADLPLAVAEISATIDRLEPSILPIEAPRKLHSLKWDSVNFDSLMVLPPGFHDSFAAQDPSLAGRTFVLFPAYGCEFSDAESKETMDTLRHHSVSTLDWTRDPSPRVSMRYSNPVAGAGSVGHRRGIAGFPLALKEAEALVDSPGAFIELENFRHQVMRISHTDAALTVTSDSDGVPGIISADQVRDLVARFLERGF